MINIKSILVFISFLFLGVWVLAQKTIQPKGLEYEYKGIIYNKETAYNFTLHTNGLNVGVDFGKLRTYYKTRFYHLSLGYITHPLEDRQNKNASLEGLGTSRSFRFGKRNSFYLIRGGVGEKRYKSEKATRRGVAVGWSYELGPVLGILKPVQNIYLVDRENNGIKVPIEITYDDDPELFLDYPSIFGRSSSLEPWTRIGVRPGLQAKAGVHFAMGAYDKYVRALDIGIMADYFGVKIPIIVENESHTNNAFFLNIYATVQLGSRE